VSLGKLVEKAEKGLLICRAYKLYEYLKVIYFLILSWYPIKKKLSIYPIG